MRFPSGVTDQYLYFVAVDATDYVTRETGLSSFTVRRSRNGGASAAFTTPTITETDSVNMPGVYELLLDEDMTLDAGDQSQEVCLHITHAGMAPVTRVFELYRPSVTAGETLTVASGGLNAAMGTGIITAGSIAADAIGASELAADAVAEIQSGLATAAALAVVDDFLDTEIAAIITAIDALPTNAELATALGTADDAVLAAIAALNNLSAAQVNAEVVDALSVDTYAEPGQGNPAATASLAAKIGYLYKAWRNKKTVTSTTHSLFADDGTTVDQKSSVSDSAGTFTETEKATGP